MNKIFRTVYNHSTNTWAAVSELAKGRVKSSSINSPLNLFSLSSTTVAIIAIATGIGVSSIAMGDTVIIKDGTLIPIQMERQVLLLQLFLVILVLLIFNLQIQTQP